MKRYLLLFLTISITIVSCHSPSYTFDRTSSRYFKISKGKYLLNTIEAPEAVRLDMQEMIFDDFSEYIGKNNLITLQNAPVNLIPSKISFHPNQETIRQLDESTDDFDYIINIKTEVQSDDVGAIQIGNLDEFDKNIVTIGMEIINLDNHASVYFAQVRGELSDRNDTKDFSFAVSTNTMLKKGLKKILKRIRKNN